MTNQHEALTAPRRQWLADGKHGHRVLLVDSITQLVASDAGAIVITGSHGGRSSASFALQHPMALVVFNDAGIGKDQAGIEALNLLLRQGRAAAAVAHHSARIGDAMDAWAHGVLSFINPLAARLGLLPGMSLHDVLR